MSMPPVDKKIEWNGHSVNELTFAQKCNAFAWIGGQFERSVFEQSFTSTEVMISLASRWETFVPLCIPTFTEWDKLPETDLIDAVVKCSEANEVGEFLINFFTRTFKELAETSR